MHWHTIKYDAQAGKVEIYRHTPEIENGDPLILLEADLDKFGHTPDAADKLAGWLGRILLVDNPEVCRRMGLG
jgi:hypothetical protein